MEVSQSNIRSEDCTCTTNSSEWLPDAKKQFSPYMYSNPFAEVLKNEQTEDIQHCGVCMKGFYNSHELQEHERTHMGGTLGTNSDRVTGGSVGHHTSASSDCDMLRGVSACPHTTDCESNSADGHMPHSNLCHHSNVSDKGGGLTSSSSSLRVGRVNIKRVSEASSTTAMYPCELCGEKFTLRGNMMKHKKMHEGQRPFTCPICGKEFSLRGNMKKHQVIHEGAKPFKCAICGRQFSLRGNLQQHQAVHTGAKPFVCSVCGRQFSLRGNMEKHKRIHNY